MDNEKPEQEDRRVNHELRAIYVEACTLLAPLVLGKDKTLMSGFAKAHFVRNNFPSLSSADAQLVVTIVERMHRENRLHTLLEK